MIIDLNDKVTVYLTPRGEEVYREYLLRSEVSRQSIPDDDQTAAKFRLCDLMEIFGPHIKARGEEFFQDNVIYV